MSTLIKAIELRENDRAEEALEILKRLVEHMPDDAQVNYQCAWSYDVLGKEKEAVPYYEKAIKLGLPEKEQKEAYLGLGSTYRTIGEYEKSEVLLTEGVKIFDDNALRTFLAMTKYNLGKHDEAMEILLKIVSSTSSDPSVSNFSKAIAYYSDKLDRLW